MAKRVYTKYEAETLPSRELFRVSWNAPFIVCGFIEEPEGGYTAHTCHAEDEQHVEQYRRYLDSVCGEFVFQTNGTYCRR